MSQKPSKAGILDVLGNGHWHDVDSVANSLGLASETKPDLLSTLSELLGPIVQDLATVRNGLGENLNRVVVPDLQVWLRNRNEKVGFLQLAKNQILVIADQRGEIRLRRMSAVNAKDLEAALESVDESFALIPHGEITPLLQQVQVPKHLLLIDFAHPPEQLSFGSRSAGGTHLSPLLRHLEQESINIIREAVAAAAKPAMLFSLGKDSMVMLRLAEKAFAPGGLPFPLVNIDTRWKFQDMNRFRDWMKARGDLSFIHYTNPDALLNDTNPFIHGSAFHTDVTKTQALRRVIDENGFDFLLGGARRDEEPARAKERVFSVRDSLHQWNPRYQRPEFWNHFNTHLVNGQTMRVFPLSNWTEIDVWRYIEAEKLPLVPLYFSKTRPVVTRGETLIMVDDDRFALQEGEQIEFRSVRFRSLGCYPLSGAVESGASSVTEIIEELLRSQVSERSSRLIDKDRGSSMEQKKIEGYF